MRRLLAAVAVAGVALAPAVPASASHYSRSCGGVLDYECEGWVCPSDCWYRDCLVWIDPFHNPLVAQCVRPIVR